MRRILPFTPAQAMATCARRLTSARYHFRSLSRKQLGTLFDIPASAAGAEAIDPSWAADLAALIDPGALF